MKEYYMQLQSTTTERCGKEKEKERELICHKRVAARIHQGRGETAERIHRRIIHPSPLFEVL